MSADVRYINRIISTMTATAILKRQQVTVTVTKRTK